MLDERQMDLAARTLVGCWRTGSRIAHLPSALRPTTLDEGYGIQACFERRSGSARIGWKLAATSAEGQAHIAVDGPLAGRILAESVIPDGGNCPFGANRMAVAEIEFAFRLGRDLAPRTEPFTVAEILDAVAALHPAIEIPDSRYVEPHRVGAPQIIAENACGHVFVFGAAAPERWRELDLAQHGVTGIVEGKLERPGIGANVLGDPRIALTWLVNELARRGIPLAAGEMVSTGTCLKPLAIAPGDRVAGDFGVLGKVAVAISE